MSIAWHEAGMVRGNGYLVHDQVVTVLPPDAEGAAQRDGVAGRKPCPGWIKDLEPRRAL